MNEYLIPFYLKYVVNYSSKYNSKEFNKFVFILNQLKEKSKFDKNEFINLVTLIYALNPEVRKSDKTYFIRSNIYNTKKKLKCI